MGASCLRPYLQPAQAAVIATPLVVQQGLACPLRAWLDNVDPVAVAIAQQPVFERASRALDLALDDGPVNLLDRPLAKLFRQPRRPLAGPGEQHHARDRPIEPLDDAEKDLARLGVFLLEVGLDRPIEGFFLALKMRTGHPARLGDREAMVVF